MESDKYCIETEIAPFKKTLVEHPLYRKITTIERLRIFMESHIYAVWDFMSLLKELQRQLTCVTVPWVPIGNPETRYFINEIVSGEESDIGHSGNYRMSHFELYLLAMQQAGCDVSVINSFLEDLKRGAWIDEALSNNGISFPVRLFVKNTFEIIETRKLHLQAAVFTYGRENLIPSIFLSFIEKLNVDTRNQATILEYYMRRHIEVDSDHHGFLARHMTSELCGDDPIKWQEAGFAVKRALLARITLWNSISDKIDVQFG